MTKTAIDKVAQQIWKAWEEHKTISNNSLRDSIGTVLEGYAVQDAIAQISGLHCVGWKVGATSRAAQELLSLPGPLSGCLFAPYRYDSPAVIDAKSSGLRALEPEIAFRMGRDLPPRDEPYDAGDITGDIAWAHPALELPKSRWNDWRAVGAPAFIADNSAAGFFVLGAEVEDWRDIDLTALEARLVINGEPVETGAGANVMDGPVSVVAWLANHLIDRGLSLHAGDLITTGTCTPIGFAKPGDEVIADFGSFGQAVVRFE